MPLFLGIGVAVLGIVAWLVSRMSLIRHKRAVKATPAGQTPPTPPKWVRTVPYMALGLVTFGIVGILAAATKDKDVVNTTSTATAATSTATGSVSLGDARLAQLTEQIKNGQIKTVEDLRALIAKGNFSKEEKIQIEALLSGKLGTSQVAGNKLEGGKQPAFSGKLTASPVKCESTFMQEVNWILCEPGVLLDSTATFTRAEVDTVYQTNCPEGGFWYGSMHHGKVLLPDNVGGVSLELKDYGPGTNHLVVIRCRLSDGKRDSDLNFTMKIGNFVVGHAIWSPIPAQSTYGSAYVSMGWFGQQLITSSTTGGTNCGSDGCSKVYVNVYDVNSQSWKEFLVTNITGKPSGNGIVDYEKGDWKIQ